MKLLFAFICVKATAFTRMNANKTSDIVVMYTICSSFIMLIKLSSQTALKYEAH